MLVIRPMGKMKEGKEVVAGIGGGQKAKAGITKGAGNLEILFLTY
jgi:hypothetical protein